ncbi:MAG: hypothetical protein AAF432_12725 [Planctomycetota bacterium]
MIRDHGVWLTDALRTRPDVPRIPVRKVAEGGFAHLSTSPEGRRIAQHWWESALDQLD